MNAQFVRCLSFDEQEQRSILRFLDLLLYDGVVLQCVITARQSVHGFEDEELVGQKRIGGDDFFDVSNTTDILLETVDPLYRTKLSGNVPRTRAKFDVVFAFFFPPSGTVIPVGERLN